MLGQWLEHGVEQAASGRRGGERLKAGPDLLERGGGFRGGRTGRLAWLGVELPVALLEDPNPVGRVSEREPARVGVGLGVQRHLAHGIQFGRERGPRLDFAFQVRVRDIPRQRQLHQFLFKGLDARVRFWRLAAPTSASCRADAATRSASASARAASAEDFSDCARRF